MIETEVAATVAILYQYILVDRQIYCICADLETGPYNLYQLASF